MCVLHEQSLDKITPRCLCSGTSFICWFCTNRGRWSGLFIVLEISIDSVLDGLKVTSHLLAHEFIFCRSSFKISAIIIGFSTIIERLVSSANNFTFEVLSDTISYMYMRTNNGQRMEPWGTPASMVTIFENTPFKQTRCLRPYK